MKLTIILLGMALAIYGSIAVPMSYIQENERELYEDDQFCEVLKSVKWTSKISKQGKSLLAAIYAGGFCGAQNIEKAKEIYGELHNHDPHEIGLELFYVAAEEADLQYRKGSLPRLEVVRALFTESKKLGFLPNAHAINALKHGGLESEYHAIDH